MKYLLYATSILFIAFTVKGYKIEKGNFVIWDEAHFGKFSQHYLNRNFYFDVHPPLGKLLTALSGYIYGQSENFIFSSSEQFPLEFDYVGMRRFHAFIGSLIPLFAFLTLRTLGFPCRRAFLCSFLFIFENGMTSITRLILLDSHMMLFTSLIGLMAALHQKHRRKNTTSPLALAGLGASIGCAISVKWIGCLTMLLVGLYVIYDLDHVLRSNPLPVFIRILFQYTIYLILLPAALYIGLFYLHFRIVNKSSSEDGFVSVPFQMSLKGSPYSKLRKYISFGHQVTLKGANGYLHSHRHEYPVTYMTNKLLQATTYNARDVNNNIYFQKVTDNKASEFLSDGDRVVILHAETKAYFEAQDSPAILSEGNMLGAREGPLTTGSIWVVQLEKPGRVRTISDKFYLWNEQYGCFMKSSKKVYPSWGYKQGEVYCAKDRDSDALWSVEENFYSEPEDNPLYTSLTHSFIRMLIEHHILMWKTNKSFVQDDDLEPDAIVSRPVEWPILRRGMRMSQWGNHHKFYMFYNPLTCLLIGLAIFLAPAIWSTKQIMLERGKAQTAAKNVCVRKAKQRKLISKSMRDSFMLFLGIGGWLIHYVPFFFVSRVLYMHHYFSAMYFSLFAVSYILNQLSYRAHLMVTAAVVLVYVLYSPLTYGFLSEDKVRHLKLFSTWDFTD